jgi:hypothetical protein
MKAIEEKVTSLSRLVHGIVDVLEGTNVPGFQALRPREDAAMSKAITRKAADRAKGKKVDVESPFVSALPAKIRERAIEELTKRKDWRPPEPPAPLATMLAAKDDGNGPIDIDMD